MVQCNVFRTALATIKTILYVTAASFVVVDLRYVKVNLILNTTILYIKYVSMALFVILDLAYVNWYLLLNATIL